MENNECSVSDAISKYIALYGQSTLQTKIAHVIDGLKCVARRIIWTIGTNEKPRRVSAITGSVLEKYHPSGDMSISEAIARLAQPYNNIMPLIDSETNVGMYGGGRASAPRYLDVFAAKFTQDVYFNGIDSGVYPYIPTEYGEGHEPAYLIPKIPMALLTGDFGMAIGHKTELAMMEFNSVCELVKKYINLREQYGIDGIPNSVLFKETAELLVPDFPVYGLLRNRNELVKEYTRGNFETTVISDGVLEIYPTNITITSLPWGIAPGKVDKEMGEYMVSKLNSTTPKAILPKVEFMHKYFTEVGEHSSGDVEASLEFTIRRGVSPFAALSKLKDMTHFNGRFNPKTLLLNTGGICRYMNPLEVLEIWYNERVKSILNELKLVQNRYLRKVRELEAQIVIVDHTNEVTSIFQNSEDDIEACLILAKKFGLTEAQARYIKSISMSDLTRRGKGALAEEKEKIGQRLIDMRSRFSAIDKSIYEDVDELQKKYAKKSPRKCKFPDFVGAVKINDEGFIQVRSMNEMDEYMSRFDSRNVDIYLYPSGPKHKLVLKNDVVLDESELDHPREFIADQLVVTRFKPKYTLTNSDGCVGRLQGIKGSSDIDTTYVGDNILVIDGDGSVSQLPATDITLRKSIVAKGARRDVLYLSDQVAEEVIVAYCNTREKNIVRISRVTVGPGKILKIALGKTQVIGVFRVDSNFAMSIPVTYLNRCNVRHLYLNGSDFESNSNVKIDLSKKTSDDKRKIVPITKRSHIYKLNK